MDLKFVFGVFCLLIVSSYANNSNNWQTFNANPNPAYNQHQHQYQQQQPVPNNNNRGYGQPCQWDTECQTVMGNGAYCQKNGGPYSGICMCQPYHWYHNRLQQCYPLANKVGDFCMNDGHCRQVGHQVRCINEACTLSCQGDPNCGQHGYRPNPGNGYNAGTTLFHNSAVSLLFVISAVILRNL